MRRETAPAVDVLLRVLPRLLRHVHSGLRDHPLTLPQLRVLAALSDGERPAGEVARELGIRPSTLTGLVKPLNRLDLVTRRRHPAAWRVVLLGLSPAGRDVYRSAHAAARVRLGELVAELSTQEQAALMHALTSLEAALESSALPRVPAVPAAARVLRRASPQKARKEVMAAIELSDHY
jgi:DNA-binding MarR family transcriptional regulator